MPRGSITRRFSNGEPTEIYVEAPGYAPFAAANGEALVRDGELDIELGAESRIHLEVVDADGALFRLVSEALSLAKTLNVLRNTWTCGADAAADLLFRP